MTEHPCLATILDTSRLVRVGRLAEVWPGPISAAVLTAPDTELFSEHRLVQAALASMVREPQHLRVTLMENTGCAPRSHSHAAPPLLLNASSPGASAVGLANSFPKGPRGGGAKPFVSALSM